MSGDAASGRGFGSIGRYAAFVAPALGLALRGGGGTTRHVCPAVAVGVVCNPDVVDGRFTVISVGAVAVGGCAIALGGGPSGSWCGWNPDDAVGAVAVGGGPSGSCCGWSPGDAVGAVAVGVVFA